jgi:fumarylacetoacetase
MQSWVQIPANSDFTIYNLPFGVWSAGRKKTRLGVAIGNEILDLYAVAEAGHFDDLGFNKQVFDNQYLNEFIAFGKSHTTALRLRVQTLLSDPDSPLKATPGLFLVPQAEATMHLPVKIGDYTDFYSSIEHATNVGIMFRDPANALLPNWRHLPVAYHGRASSIVVSGTPIKRPHGQVLPKGETQPVYQASARVDFELETGFIIGKASPMGKQITTSEAIDYIFGMVLFNDWSARDIQSWEYVPLGPFLGKNFGSSVSPWVVTMDALEPFKTVGPVQEPEVLPYLKTNGDQNYDIALEVSITPDKGEENIVCRSNFKFMYWNMLQQLAHHTVNGCNLNIGDLMASGTISGYAPDSYGSMLELAWMGTKPITLSDGSTRVFIKDGDTVTLRGYCEKEGIRVGFGEVSGTILPANAE